MLIAFSFVFPMNVILLIETRSHYIIFLYFKLLKAKVNTIYLSFFSKEKVNVLLMSL